MDLFDDLFASYSAFYLAHGPQPDRAARAPWVFADLWDRRGWRPDPAQTLLVTGSKGKGTVARQLAWSLQAEGPTGLVVSPEECGHLDRIRIDNQPISAAAFERLWRAIAPEAQAMAAQAGAGRYLSPSGWFLSVALAWFHERGVRRVVVEGGRGVCCDEIGQLGARLGVVTSVYGEHLAAIGPTLADVWDDKLALAARVRRLVVAPQVAQAAQALGRQLPAHAIVAPAQQACVRPGEPAWLEHERALSAAALAAWSPRARLRWQNSPSFTRTSLAGTPLWLEPVVHPDSLDPAFLHHLAGQGVAVVLGLPDDKAVGAILARLAASGLTDLAAFALCSPVGHVQSRWIERAPALRRLGLLDVVHPDVDALRAQLAQHAAQRRGLYVIGVQVFVRTLRAVCGLALAGPTDHDGSSKGMIAP